MIYRCVETFPPAKLNLFLEILGKRADGFHELDTVMVAIDLRDAMRIELLPNPEIQLSCRWLPSRQQRADRLGKSTADPSLDLPPPQDNLVYRALAMFRDEFSVEQGFRVQLDKRIPSGAGMGGASSDAASALSSAAMLCGIDMDDDRIVSIASKLGSDVPFFLGRSTSKNDSIHQRTNNSNKRLKGARGRGRGEQLDCFNTNANLHFVVVYPPEPLSTAEVYRHCDLSDSTHDATECCRVLTENRPGELPPHLHNRLAGPARKLSVWIDKTLAAIRRTGLEGVTMTGSGSACFGLAPSARVARRTASRLASRGIGLCFAAQSDRLPAPIRFLT